MIHRYNTLLSIIVFVFMGTFVINGFSFASFSDSEQTLVLDEVVVIEGKLQEEEAKDATAFVTIINPQEYTTRVSSVPELLSQSVGINVREYGGLGSFSTVSIRGSSSEQVAIFLDGVLLNQARQGTVNLSEIPLDNIEKIEVYRGTSPARFGTAGIGGVINIITRSPDKKPQTELSYSYGSFDTYKTDLYRSEMIKNFNYLLFFTLNRSRGNFKYLDDNGTPLNQDDDQETRRKNNAFLSRDLLLKLGYEWNRWNFSLSSDLFSSDKGIPGISSYQSKTASLETLRNLSNLKIMKNGFLHPSLNLESLFFFTYEWDKYQDKKGEIGVGFQDNRDKTISYGGNILLSQNYSRPHFNNSFNIYAELKWERYDSENKLNPQPKGDTQKRTTLSLAIEEQLYLLRDRLILSPSFIFNHYHNEFNGKLPFTYKWITPGENRNKGYWNRKMGAELRITDFISIKSNVGKYFRAPSFTELFGDRGTLIGNPSLNAEEGTNWDVGFRIMKKEFMFMKNILFEYAYYQSTTDNLILFIPNSQRTSVATNISEAEMHGHEISWASSIFGCINISGNLTIQDTEDKSDISYWKGNQLPGRPEYELFNRFEILHNLGKIFYEFNYLSNNYLDRANFTKIAARKIHNVGFSLYGTKNLTLTFEVKNLSDAKIEDFIGFPLPGRSCFGTVNYKF